MWQRDDEVSRSLTVSGGLHTALETKGNALRHVPRRLTDRVIILLPVY